MNTYENQLALINAAMSGDKAKVQELIEKGANVNAQLGDDTTALMRASCKGHTKIAELLIKAGANVDQKNTKGWTALMWCAFQGNKKTAELLINNGADVDATTKSGLSALILSQKYHNHGVRQCLKCFLSGRAEAIESLKTGDIKQAHEHFRRSFISAKIQDKIIADVLKERCRTRNSAIITAGYRQAIKNLAEEHALRQLIPHNQEKQREQLREALEGGVDVKNMIAALGDPPPQLDDVKKILIKSLESQQVQTPKGFFSRMLRRIADIFFGTTNQSELEVRMKFVREAENMESAFGASKGLTIAQLDSRMMPLETPEGPLRKSSPEGGIEKSSSVLSFSNADSSAENHREKPKQS